MLTPTNDLKFSSNRPFAFCARDKDFDLFQDNGEVKAPASFFCYGKVFRTNNLFSINEGNLFEQREFLEPR